MSRQVINPDGVPDSTEFGYNQLIVTESTIYASGQPGWDESFDVVGDSVEAQTQQAFDNVEALLAAVDKDLEDLVKVTCYLVDAPENLEEFLTVWNERLGEPRPCNTVVGVDSLALEAFLVELEIEVPHEG